MNKEYTELRSKQIENNPHKGKSTAAELMVKEFVEKCPDKVVDGYNISSVYYDWMTNEKPLDEDELIKEIERINNEL